MRAYYKEGFVLFKNNTDGPVFISPHSTMTLSPVVRGDVGTELITARLTKSIGSLGVASIIPRAGRYGIDFFRKPATMDEVLQMFKSSDDYRKRHAFEKKYAFYARDQEEYLSKITIHNNFWTSAETLAPKNPLFVLIHSQSMRLKNFPSVLDVCTNSGKWFNEDMVKEAIEKSNTKHKYSLHKIKKHMKRYTISWANIWLRRSIGYRFKNFDLRTLRGSFKNEVRKDLEKASDILGTDIKDLERNLDWNKYLEILQDCIDATDFKITYQMTFTGKKGEANMRNLIAKKNGSAIMFETSSFLNEMYPRTSTKIVEDVLQHATMKNKWSTFEKFFGD